jgi:hypothetical protein
MRELVVRHPLIGEPGAAIDALWSGAEWTKRWDPVRAFRIDYDDGIHQVGRLTVEWEGKPSEMRLVRFREGPERIEFFCPEPPDPLSYQSGSWSVSTDDSGLFLVARRRIALKPAPGEPASAAEDRLELHLAQLERRLCALLPRFAARAA